MKLTNKLKFNKLNTQRRKISKSFHSFMESIIAAKFSKFTYKKTGYFSFKVRIDELSIGSTKYNLFFNQQVSDYTYNFYGKQGAEYNLANHQLYKIYNDNIKISVDDVEKNSSGIDALKDIINGLKGEVFISHYNKYIESFISLTAQMNEIYCSYYIESETGLSVDTYFDSFNECIYLNGVIPVFSNYEKTSIKYTHERGNTVTGLLIYIMTYEKNVFHINKKIKINKTSHYHYDDYSHLPDGLVDVGSYTLSKDQLLDFNNKDNIKNHSYLFNNVKIILNKPFSNHDLKWGKRSLNDSFLIMHKSLRFLNEDFFEKKDIQTDVIRSKVKIKGDLINVKTIPHRYKYLRHYSGLYEVNQKELLADNFFYEGITREAYYNDLNAFLGQSISDVYKDTDVHYCEDNETYLSVIYHLEEKEFKIYCK